MQMPMIKVSEVLEAVEKLKAAGADISQCVLVPYPDLKTKFIIATKKDITDATN